VSRTSVTIRGEYARSRDFQARVTLFQARVTLLPFRVTLRVTPRVETEAHMFRGGRT
jgi:hypothetical protein